MADPVNSMAGLGLVGGRLCLDFANTVGARGAENRHDHLPGYPHLVWWGVHAGAVTETEAEGLLRKAGAEPEAADRVFRRAISLREAISRIFSAVVADRTAESEDMDRVNDELAQAMSRARIVATPDGFAWDWDRTEDLDRVVWPVVRSVADLLTSPELARVGECAGDRCGWLFLDESKNRSRRWCDMRDCGNRAKVRRHYRRTQETAREAGG